MHIMLLLSTKKWHSDLNFFFLIFNFIYFILTKTLSLIFRERGGERGRKREKLQCERRALIGCLPHVPQLSIKPTTQLYALTRN